MTKVRKRVKKTGVFRTPEEFNDFFTALRIIIHSHCYESNPQYEVMMATMLCALMSEYHAFVNIGIEPLDIVWTEEDEVTRKNILQIVKDISEKVELSNKLKGESNDNRER